MISGKKQKLICFFLLLAVFVADGRRFKQRSYQQRHNKVKHYTPLLRQLDTATITGTAEEDDDLTGTGTGTGTGSGMDVASTGTGAEEDDELYYDRHENDTKPSDALVLINPKQGADTSRLFKGFFIRALLGSGIGASTGNSNIPYIILNVPNNITNVNINTLNNTASVATNGTATTTTTAAPARRQVFYQPFSDVQSEIYQQHRSKPEQQAQNFILSPSNQLLPVYLPPEIQHLVQSNPVGQRKRPQLNRKNVNNQNNFNPFSFLGNNLRRIQYL